MATNRKTIFATGEIYHVFNLGVERRDIFTDIREYKRAVETIRFYLHSNLPIRYSQFINLPLNLKEEFSEKLKQLEREVSIIAYCLMPNHFHLILKQLREKGLTRFLSNITNSYTRYFNAKHKRIGHLFRGPFKAVHIETDQQLFHLTRYLHLNPVASFLVNINKLKGYIWSSFPEYLDLVKDPICNTSLTDSVFRKREDYEKFVYNQIEYAQKLEKIKHLAIDSKNEETV